MTTSLDQLLQQSARVQDDQLETPELSAAMTVAFSAARVEAGPPRATGRPGWRRRAAAAVAGVALVAVGLSGVPAFAGWVELHTGQCDTGSW